ncbi:MAG TPA: outer membrane beta-barrel protein [Thermoanaerobaculia bacterium]|nr:outer membrane beta-barrel protein [Thermoanaerobaculia bacterium]
MRSRSLLLTLILALVSVAASAQFAQYTTPGSLATRGITLKERLENGMRDARWRLGGLRLEPQLGLRDVSYVDNVNPGRSPKVSDVTATGVAGLIGYMPAGRKTIFSAYAAPEYTWWDKLADRRGWRGRYGLGGFGFFNHLSLEVRATDVKQDQYPSFEVLTPATVDQQTGRASFELEVGAAISLFASVEEQRFNYQSLPQQGLELSGLDRTQRIAFGGVRYSLRNGLKVGVGVETASSSFKHSLRDRSNSGSGPLLDMQLQGGRTFLNLHVAYLTLKARQGADFPRYRNLTGRAQVGWKPHGAVSYTLYSSRDVVYGIETQAPYADSWLSGIGAEAPLGWRFDARLFVEAGSLDFGSSQGGGGGRRDNILNYGLNLTTKLRGSLSFGIHVIHTTIHSNDSGFNRSLTSIGSTLTIGSQGTPF